ncbi:receptor-like protein 20 [Nymphaea colorata]|nr:receptor-like protein 20 [Nymphaea colorata]
MGYLTALFLFDRAPLLSWKLCIVFTLFTLLCIGEGVTTGAGLPCFSNQSVALLRFKESLSLRPQKFFSSWRNGSDCCTWKGVSCDGTGFVTSLNIYDLSAQASELHPSLFELGRLRHLELSFNLISGTIPSRLSELTDLTELSLSHCNFTGSIPESFKQLSNLTLLDLSNNNLSGEIPPGLLNLPTLQYLSLHANELSGPLPDFGTGFSILNSVDLSDNMLEGEIPSSISNSPHLELLELGANRFSGTIHLSSFQNLKNLSYLSLSDNELTVKVPDLDHHAAIFLHLQDLFLSSCNIEGEFPQFLQNTKELVLLDLSHNKISGKMQTWVWELPQLERLYLSDNILCGFEEAVNISSSMNLDLDLGSQTKFPSKKPFKIISLMSNLDLSNNIIRGAIPPTLFCNLLKLEVLYLSGNNLTGTIPNCIANLTRLDLLDLGGNQLQGLIPRELICDLSSLGLIRVKGNQLTDELARFLYNCSSEIWAIDLSHNRLMGSLPSNWLTSFRWLQVLDLSNNQLHGPIPNELDSRSIASLRVINLNHNKLVGSIPRFLANCSQLEVINLSMNELSDVFPFWLGHLQFLRILMLSSNKLYGSVCSPFSKNVFSSLQILDISGNQLTGPLPPSLFQGFSSMMAGQSKVEGQYISFSRFYEVMLLTIKGHFRVKKFLPEFIVRDEELPLTIKGQNQARRIIHMLASIDLSNNLFIGRVPDEIGALDGLCSLNLSWNNLDGPIPRSLGHLQQMESLDLSHNYLSGSIPEELTRDTFLSVLDLSCNNLQGRIPQGKQFGTFDATSFDGNPGLCGPPLPISCPITNLGVQDPINHVREIARDPHWGYFAAGIGYSMGFLTIILPILFIEKVGSWFCVHVDRAFEACIRILTLSSILCKV